MAVAAVDRHKRPGVSLLATPIDKAIAFGCNAPNPHNTQAWKFRNTSELETVFYVDEERLLPVTDPSARTSFGSAQKGTSKPDDRPPVLPRPVSPAV